MQKITLNNTVKLKPLRLNRKNADGKFEKWEFHIESNNGQIYVTEEKLLQAVESAPLPPHLARLAKHGFEFSRRPDGSTDVVKTPVNTSQVMSFFEDKTAPFFEGYEELRSEYLKEMAGLSDDCPDCARGEVINKYMDLVFQKLS